MAQQGKETAGDAIDEVLREEGSPQKMLASALVLALLAFVTFGWRPYTRGRDIRETIATHGCSEITRVDLDYDAGLRRLEQLQTPPAPPSRGEGVVSEITGCGRTWLVVTDTTFFGAEVTSVTDARDVKKLELQPIVLQPIR